MDSLPRKRKLSEFGTNLTSPFINTSEENENKIPNKCQRIHSDATEEVFQEKSANYLKAIVESSENEKKDVQANEEKSGPRSERIKQIDLGSLGNGNVFVWYNTDYLEDIISHEIHKESSYELSENFCRKYDINPTGREILIDWLISVQEEVKAENSVLHLAVALLDIMLDTVYIPLDGMQAAAIAVFWVAYKFIHGSISMKTLLGFCAGTVTKGMIRCNEILVLHTSHFLQAGGSLSVFFNYLLYSIFGAKFPPEIYHSGLYFIEIMLLQFIFVDCHANEKAVTAVFTALSVFGSAAQFDLVDVSRFITRRKLQHAYRRLLHSLRLMYNDKAALKKSTVYRKYKSSKYFKISVHRNLKCLATA